MDAEADGIVSNGRLVTYRHQVKNHFTTQLRIVCFDSHILIQAGHVQFCIIL